MARTQTVTILFCDLVASTERRAHPGDDAFDECSRRYMTALEDAIEQNNGRSIASNPIRRAVVTLARTAGKCRRAIVNRAVRAPGPRGGRPMFRGRRDTVR
jgi:class 3 adenylate cyclase